MRRCFFFAIVAACSAPAFAQDAQPLPSPEELNSANSFTIAGGGGIVPDYEGSDDYRLVKTMLYQRPDLMHKMLQINADAVAAYLNCQIEAGAQAVMIFDSWGGVLADGAFQEFSLAYTARVLAQVKKTHDGVRIPRIVFTKGGGLWLSDMGQLDCDVLGLDWTVNLARARALVGENTAGRLAKALQGNIDPNVLFAKPEQVEREVAKVLTSFGTPLRAPPGQPDATGPTHIFNLGHGISQYTPPENVAALVRAVHSQSKELRKRDAVST